MYVLYKNLIFTQSLHNLPFQQQQQQQQQQDDTFRNFSRKKRLRFLGLKLGTKKLPRAKDNKK